MKTILDKVNAALDEISEKVKPNVKEKALACSAAIGSGCSVEVEVKSEDAVSRDEMKSFGEYIDYRIRSIREDISNLYNRFWEHQEGHLPKIVGAANMEKALEAIGLAGDYKVEKRTIYANDGTVSSVEWNMKKVPNVIISAATNDDIKAVLSADKQ